MNRKQRLFVKEYLIDLDQRAAYTRAGYTGVGEACRAAASIMIRTHVIHKAIEAEMKKREKRLYICSDLVLQELCKLGFDDDENYKHKKNSDKIKALELIGKHIGMWKDKLEVQVQVPNLILQRSPGITIEHEKIKEKVLEHLPYGYAQDAEDQEKEGETETVLIDG